VREEQELPWTKITGLPAPSLCRNAICCPSRVICCSPTFIPFRSKRSRYFNTIMSISYDGERKDWGRWGEQDEIGRANLLDDALVAAAAAACIRTGKRFSLALPLCRPGGDPVLPGRPPARHVMEHDESYYADGRSAPLPGGMKYADDTISMPCHGTTHMDALGHAWCGDQLWNGHPAQTTAGGLTRASIGALAARGIVGRAVLVDLPRHEGTPHLEMHRRITVGEVEDALAAQHTELRRGDILLLRTGIFRVFYEDGPEAFYADFDEPGLTYEPGLIDFVVEHDIADCARDRVFDAFYVAAPLRIARGTGSPMNPIVIKLGAGPLCRLGG
jgi:kynurenine formamidase